MLSQAGEHDGERADGHRGRLPLLPLTQDCGQLLWGVSGKTFKKIVFLRLLNCRIRTQNSWNSLYIPMSHNFSIVTSHIPTGPPCLQMSPYIWRWVPIAGDEPHYLQMKQHISRCATSSPSEPPHLKKRWASSSSDESTHIKICHIIFRWVVSSEYESPHLQRSHPISSDEPRYFQMSHLIFRWVNSSPLEPLDLEMSQLISRCWRLGQRFSILQLISKWATLSPDEPP